MQGTAAPNVQVGYKLAIRGNKGNHGLFMYKTVNMQLSNITVYTVRPSADLRSLRTHRVCGNTAAQTHLGASI